MRVTQALSRNIQQQPDKIATIFGDRRRTWREHGERVQRLAGGLRDLGLAEGDRVGVIGLNSDFQLELFYATPWAGGVIVPINHRWAAPEIAYALNDSETKILFIDETFRDLATALPGLVDHDLTIVSIDGEPPSGVEFTLEDLITQNDAIDECQRQGDDLSGIFYTGGTTGRSKGVMLTHANHVSNSLQLAATGGLSRESVYLHAAPMFHIADGLYIYMITQLGGQHVIIPRFEPEACAKALETYRINVTILVPHHDPDVIGLPRSEPLRFKRIRHLVLWCLPNARGHFAALIRQPAAHRPDSTLWSNGVSSLTDLYV